MRPLLAVVTVIVFVILIGFSLTKINDSFSLYSTVVVVSSDVYSEQKLYSSFDPGNKSDVVSLPRTSSRSYNELEEGERYMTYTPSGGFNNQLLCLVAALRQGKKYRRSVVVSGLGRHTDGFRSYERLQYDSLVPMDQVIDFEALEEKSGVKLVALNVTIPEFISQLKGRKDSKFKKYLRIADITSSPGGMTRGLADSDTKVSYVHGRYFLFVSMALRDLSIFVPTPYLIDMATKITDTLFGADTPYKSLHIRLGDFIAKYTEKASPAAFFAKGLQWGWMPNASIYVASEPGFDEFLSIAKSYFPNTILPSDLTKNHQVQLILEDFANRLPRSHIRSDLFGVVEQVICARAQDWVGTVISTFSARIKFLRLAKYDFKTPWKVKAQHSVQSRLGPSKEELEDPPVKQMHALKIHLHSKKAGTARNGKSADVPDIWNF